MGEITWRDVSVAWAHPSRLQGFTADDLVAMGQAQVDRFHQLSGGRAQGFLAGRALIRDRVRRLTGLDEVVLDSRCDRCGAAHGRPTTAGVSMSVSHSDDLVVVAVRPGRESVGVDVEALASSARVDEVATLFANGLAPDLAGWTRIEAALKADGRGFAVDPDAVVLHPPSPDPPPRVWSAVLPGRASTIDVVTLAGPPGHVLSVAIG